MTTRTSTATVGRDGDWASWAPTGRAAVPAIVLLVIVANLVGVATVVLLLIGVEDGSGQRPDAELDGVAVGHQTRDVRRDRPATSSGARDVGRWSPRI